FHAEEEKGGKGFAKALASYADYYVNEAFSNCHRDHASMTGVPTYIPSCLGFHAYDELTHLSLHNAKKPIYAIIGGVKLETRVPMLENFARFAKKILLGGAMVFTFYKALGYEVGKSLVDRDEISVAKKLMKKYSNKLILPEDILVADKIGAKAKTKNVDYSQMPKSWIGVDNGKRSLKTFAQQLKDAKTIVWNGPIGIFEEAKFANGTRTIAKILAGSRAKTIIGGGDTSTAVHHFKLARKMNHVSTAGGASLTLLEGKALPAIVALEKNYGRFYKRFKKK
ncbi:MAG: phosphoglycerate kinase, partial [Candidatus Woesearchaeota archaeon]|nr:phosphoglycerate kinase [Candidatus Woesearchaeota archaeon]